MSVLNGGRSGSANDDTTSEGNPPNLAGDAKVGSVKQVSVSGGDSHGHSFEGFWIILFPTNVEY